MTRLVQGDVGAGKTVVAMLAMVDTAAAGGQSALMAPTEILARQHFETISSPLAQRGLNAAFKTSNRSSLIKNLYWAGGSVNPGPGVPMVLMSGQIAADCIIADYGTGTRKTARHAVGVG